MPLVTSEQAQQILEKYPELEKALRTGHVYDRESWFSKPEIATLIPSNTRTFETFKKLSIESYRQEGDTLLADILEKKGSVYFQNFGEIAYKALRAFSPKDNNKESSDITREQFNEMIKHASIYGIGQDNDATYELMQKLFAFVGKNPNELMGLGNYMKDFHIRAVRFIDDGNQGMNVLCDIADHLPKGKDKVLKQVKNLFAKIIPRK